MNPMAPPPPKVPEASLEQEWDADEFEIPSLKPEKEQTQEEIDTVKIDITWKEKVEVGTIYLGPHGAPPSQLRQDELKTDIAKKNKRKQKIKYADQKNYDIGRENKTDSIRDLMGSKANYHSPRADQSGWLDPHCHENMFERPS